MLWHLARCLEGTGALDEALLRFAQIRGPKTSKWAMSDVHKQLMGPKLLTQCSRN